jgi:phytoene dehydrogenase-like protein
LTHNAIIIGAGTAGLCIAALLANAGYKPLVLEKQKFVGGRARIWHKDGFTVDYGIHTLRGFYQRVFHPLKMELHKARMPISKGIIIEDRGVLHKLPKLSSLFQTKMLTLKDLNFLLRHFGALFLGDPKKYFKISIKQWLDSINASPQIANLFKLLSMTLMVCPFLERASLGEFILNLKHLNLLGFGHPEGGFHQVHQALIWKIQACGGRIQLGTKVDEILIRNGTAIGVKIAEQEIPADLIVSSIPVQQLPIILDETLLDKAYLNCIRNLRPTAGISIDYGLSEKLYREVMFLVPEPAILGSFTSNIDPSTAPKNKQLVTFLNVLNVEDVKHRQKAREKLKQAENRIFSMFPEMSKKIEWKRILNFEMVDGVELNTKQTQDKRPDVQVPNIANLFLASDSTCSEGAGGDIAFSSARLCYDRILQSRNPF